jgi:hypothetical protein
MQVDELLKLGVNVTIYSGQVRKNPRSSCLSTRSVCMFLERINGWIKLGIY